MSPAEAEMLSVPVVFSFASGRFRIAAGGTVAATGRYTERGDVVNIIFESGPPLAPPDHASSPTGASTATGLRSLLSQAANRCSTSSPGHTRIR
jgi:hypothetical protein